MYQQHAIDRLAILIKDDHISETSVGRILTDLFQRVPLRAFRVIHSTIMLLMKTLPGRNHRLAEGS